jgi:hypothetical protein
MYTHPWGKMDVGTTQTMREPLPGVRQRLMAPAIIATHLDFEWGMVNGKLSTFGGRWEMSGTYLTLNLS